MTLLFRCCGNRIKGKILLLSSVCFQYVSYMCKTSCKTIELLAAAYAQTHPLLLVSRLVQLYQVFFTFFIEYKKSLRIYSRDFRALKTDSQVKE